MVKRVNLALWSLEHSSYGVSLGFEGFSPWSLALGSPSSDCNSMVVGIAQPESDFGPSGHSHNSLRVKM